MKIVTVWHTCLARNGKEKKAVDIGNLIHNVQWGLTSKEMEDIVFQAMPSLGDECQVRWKSSGICVSSGFSIGIW